MGHMRYQDIKPYEDWFWEKNDINLRLGWVSKVNTAQKTVVFSDGEELAFDRLILAVGSKPNKFGWPGQDLNGVRGMYSLQDLQAIENATEKAEKAVIIGGGLIGVELAEMMRSRDIEVTFLVREDRFWGSVLPKEEADLIARHMCNTRDIIPEV